MADFSQEEIRQELMKRGALPGDNADSGTDNSSNMFSLKDFLNSHLSKSAGDPNRTLSDVGQDLGAGTLRMGQNVAAGIGGIGQELFQKILKDYSQNYAKRPIDVPRVNMREVMGLEGPQAIDLSKVLASKTRDPLTVGIGENLIPTLMGGASIPGQMTAAGVYGATAAQPGERLKTGLEDAALAGGLIYGGKELLMGAPTIRNAIDQFRPGKAAEEFMSNLGQGTASENIETLGKRAQFARQSEQASALAPKEELMASEGKNKIFPSQKRGDELTKQVAYVFDENPLQLDKTQTGALKSALKEYYKTGDFDSLVSKGEDLFDHPGLDKAQTAKLQETLEMEPLRNGKYQNIENVSRKYDEGLKALHDNFVQNPTLENADKLKSALSDAKRKYLDRIRRGTSTDVDELRYNQFKDKEKKLLGDMEDYFQKLPPEKQKLYQDFRQKWASTIPNYENGRPTIRKLSKGESEGLTQANINNAFKFPTDKGKAVVEAMGPEGKKNILYNELLGVKPGNADALVDALSKAKRSGGFENYISPEQEAQMEAIKAKLRNLKFLKRGGIGVGGAAAAYEGIKKVFIEKEAKEMAIDTSLFITGNMLQDYIVDKLLGTPLAGGLVYFYKDNARTTLKNVYYQTGSYNNYTYTALPNPVRLTSVGTFADNNGEDIIPFYYPYNEDTGVAEAYYVTVYATDIDGNPTTLQFVRENFPFVPTEPPAPDIQMPTFRNYIVNGNFWRNCGGIDLSSYKSFIVAPSVHQGFADPYAANSSSGSDLLGGGDIRFVKNNTSATDAVSFGTFTTPTVPGTEYYLELQCTDAGSGETTKAIQLPINVHLDILEGQSFTLTFWAKNISSSAQNSIEVNIFQYLGSGVASAVATNVSTETVATSWTKHIVQGIFPTVTGSTSVAGDDAFFIQLNFPLNSTFDIGIALPCLYLGDDFPSNEFTTYDVIESVTSSPRTGDIRTSINAFAPYGWIAANDDTIGSPSSTASTNNVSTWPIYNLIWNNVSDNYAPVNTGRGASAYADYSANKYMNLTQNLGRVLAGLNPIVTAQVFTTNHGSSNTELNLTNAFTILTGSPVLLSTTSALPTGFSINTVYYAIFVSTTVIKLAATLELAIAGTALTFSGDGTGTQTVSNALGATIGASTETLAQANLPNISLPLTGVHLFTTYSGGGNNGSFATGDNSTDRGTSTSQSGVVPLGGSGTAFDLHQPSTYMNVFIKL